MTRARTKGIHHLGLTVTDAEQTAAFFTEVLGFNEIRRVPDYPAIFVSDGTVMLTLWQLQTDNTVHHFDRRHNVGLHHVALTVDSLDELNTLHAQLKEMTDVKIEFAPELLREGPARHMMCYEPGGIRMEFIWPGL